MDPETVRFLAETAAPTIPKPLEIADLMTTVQKTLDDANKHPAGSA